MPQQRKPSKITDFTGKRWKQQKPPWSYDSAATDGIHNKFDPLQDNDDDILPEAKSHHATSSEDSSSNQKIYNDHQDFTLSSASSDSSVHLAYKKEFPALSTNAKDQTMV